jgi:phosphatidylglycerophosphate synthase
MPSSYTEYVETHWFWRHILTFVQALRTFTNAQGTPIVTATFMTRCRWITLIGTTILILGARHEYILIQWLGLILMGSGLATDFLDGFIARYYNEQSAQGGYEERFRDKEVIVGTYLLLWYFKPFPIFDSWLYVTALWAHICIESLAYISARHHKAFEESVPVHIREAAQHSQDAESVGKHKMLGQSFAPLIALFLCILSLEDHILTFVPALALLYFAPQGYKSMMNHWKKHDTLRTHLLHTFCRED